MNTFLALYLASAGATSFDIETTMAGLKRCAPACYEANPIMRPFVDSRAKAYTVAMGLTSLSAYGSHKLREGGSKWWWVPMAVNIGVHVGFATANRGVR